MDRESPRVSVVIVTHNRCELVLSSLKSVFSDSYPNKEVIVIDDASVDGTAEKLRAAFPTQIQIIVNHRVRLLAASRNIGMARCRAKYLLSMDDDCILSDRNVISELVRILDVNRDIGAAAPAVLTTNSKMAYCGGRLFPVYRPMRPKTDKRSLLRCDFIPGTIGLYRKDALERVKGWDSTRFPWHAEDADLSLRLREAGYEIVCAPWIRARHLKAHIVDISTKERAYYAGMSRIMLYKSHLTEIGYAAWLAMGSMPVVIFYAIYLISRYRRRGLGLLRFYIRGVSAGLLMRTGPRRAIVH